MHLNVNNTRSCVFQNNGSYEFLISNPKFPLKFFLIFIVKDQKLLNFKILPNCPKLLSKITYYVLEVDQFRKFTSEHQI